MVKVYCFGSIFNPSLTGAFYVWYPLCYTCHIGLPRILVYVMCVCYVVYVLCVRFACVLCVCVCACVCVFNNS